jgi:hypothetical protein
MLFAMTDCLIEAGHSHSWVVVLCTLLGLFGDICHVYGHRQRPHSSQCQWFKMSITFCSIGFVHSYFLHIYSNIFFLIGWLVGWLVVGIFDIALFVVRSFS